MKKALSLAIMVIVLFISVSANAAGGTTVFIQEMDMSVVIPTEFDYFTRQVTSDDPNLKKYGITRDYVLSEMKSQGDYLVAFADGANTILEIAMFATTYNDFNTLDDSSLQQIASSFKNQYANYGVTLQKYEIYSNSQTKYIKMHMKANGSSDPFYTVQYTTGRGGNLINFTLKSYSGAITSSQESALKSVTDSAVFDAGSNSESFGNGIYKDKKTGLQLTIPSTWEEYKPSGDDGMNVDTTFFPEDGDNFVGYVSVDLWGDFSTEEKNKYTRSDVDNNYFSKTMMANTFEVPENMVRMVTYGGKQYYCVDQTWCLRLIHIENGYIYMFQYYGAKNDKNYKGFESILQSVKYPASPTKKPAATISPTATVKPTAIAEPSVEAVQSNVNDDKEQKALVFSQPSSIKWVSIAGILLWSLLPGFIARKKGRSFWGFYFLSLVITPLLTTIIALCLSKKIHPVREESSTNESRGLTSNHDDIDGVKNHVVPFLDQSASKNGDTPTPYQDIVQNDLHTEHTTNTNDSSEDEVVFCRYCGFKLLSGSDFCSHCGKKVK